MTGELITLTPEQEKARRNQPFHVQNAAAVEAPTIPDNILTRGLGEPVETPGGTLYNPPTQDGRQILATRSGIEVSYPPQSD